MKTSTLSLTSWTKNRNPIVLITINHSSYIFKSCLIKERTRLILQSFDVIFIGQDVMKNEKWNKNMTWLISKYFRYF